MIWFECSGNNISSNRFVYFLSQKSSRNNGFYITQPNFRVSMALSVARSELFMDFNEEWMIESNLYLAPKDSK